MIIGIDGSSTDLSVALVDRAGSRLGDEAWTSQGRQSAELLPRLLALLDRHHLTLADVDAIAVGTGPGSFTGLRVAMALAKGLALALDRPIVGVPGLAAWLTTEPSAEAAVARAGAREAYVLLRERDEPLIADRDRVAERLGDRPVVAPDELAAAFDLRRATRPRAAVEIARTAARSLAAGEPGDDLARLEPRYLRAPRGIEPVDGEGTVRWL